MPGTTYGWTAGLHSTVQAALLQVGWCMVMVGDKGTFPARYIPSQHQRRGEGGVYMPAATLVVNAGAQTLRLATHLNP